MEREASADSLQAMEGSPVLLRQEHLLMHVPPARCLLVR